MMELTNQERAAFEHMLIAWCDADYPIPGHVCYQDVFDLCDKMGVQRPKWLVDFCYLIDNNKK